MLSSENLVGWTNRRFKHVSWIFSACQCAAVGVWSYGGKRKNTALVHFRKIRYLRGLCVIDCMVLMRPIWSSETIWKLVLEVRKSGFMFLLLGVLLIEKYLCLKIREVSLWGGFSKGLRQCTEMSRSYYLWNRRVFLAHL